MGGVDDEPPSKRVKICSKEQHQISNKSSIITRAACLKNFSMARPLASQRETDFIGSKGVKRVEFVRIIADALYSLGYEKTGAHLEEESGINLESSELKLFTKQIIEGNWNESIITLYKIELIDEPIIKLVSFIILEQKFLELLYSEKVVDALNTLRTEISPLCINNERVKELSSLIVSSLEDGQKIAKVKCRSKLLEELRNLFPPSVIKPENRLVNLVEQALEAQQENCVFHNSLVEDISLYSDHDCGKDKIPRRTLQILDEHSDEVWFLQFSHNGKYLASSSRDHSAILWEVNADGKVSLKHRLVGHEKPISHLCWSPNDDQILTCGLEENIRRWDISSGACLHIYQKPTLNIVSCRFSHDGKQILSGLSDKSIIIWDLNGTEIECLKDQRTIMISDLEVTKDGKQVISICRETVISLLDIETKKEKYIVEGQIITSFCLSSDDKFLIVSLMNQEIHLWDIEGNVKLVCKYKGYKRSRFVVRACFGGFGQSFVAGGSEDSQVYIWMKESGELLEKLAGHSGAVNCVSWNPVNPHMLASASDDRTIRIWGLNQDQVNARQKEIIQCNGVHYCNGGTHSKKYD
jgi:WD40 repeat protein